MGHLRNLKIEQICVLGKVTSTFAVTFPDLPVPQTIRRAKTFKPSVIVR
jgi:hypothetical protein